MGPSKAYPWSRADRRWGGGGSGGGGGGGGWCTGGGGGGVEGRGRGRGVREGRLKIRNDISIPAIKKT